MHCYYCMANAWPAEVVDAYEKVLTEYQVNKELAQQALHWGLGHAVWEDENFDDVAINASRMYAMKQAQTNPALTAMELFIVLMSFEFLQRIPEAIRVPFTHEEIEAALDATGELPPPRGPMKPIPIY